MRMDNELLEGWVALNYLNDGETRYREYEKAGIPIKDVTPRENGLVNRTAEIKKYLANHPSIRRLLKNRIVLKGKFTGS